jgi:hypothetical protein
MEMQDVFDLRQNQTLSKLMSIILKQKALKDFINQIVSLSTEKVSSKKIKIILL